MNLNTRRVLTGVVAPVGGGLAALAVGTVLGVPIWGAGALAVCVYGGIYLILNNDGKSEAAEDNLAEAQAKLQASTEKVKQIRGLAKGIRVSTTRDQVMRICDLADSTIKDLLSRKDTSLSTATRFDFTFGQVLQMMQLYIQILNGHITVEPDKLDSILGKIDKEMLPQIEASLKEYAVQLDQNQIVNLETTMKLLETTLKMEGLS